MALTEEQRKEQATKVPAWLAYSFLKVKDSIPYNCAWGFLTEADLKSEEFKEVSADFSKNLNTMVKADKLANGTVIEFPLSVMQKVFATVMPEVPADFIKNYAAKRQEVYEADKQACEKFVKGLIKGNSTEVDFGLYCVNKTNAIKHGENLYKAYKLNLSTFYKIVAGLGCQDKLFIKNIETGAVTSIKQAESYRNFTIADSKNGIVCKLVYKK